MKFGICTGFENIGLLEELGYDFLEGSVQKAATMDEEEFESLRKIVNQSSIKCDVCNLFFPVAIKAVGPEANKKELEEYMKIAFERIALLGTKLVVIGSGRSRTVPEGWSMEKGLEQFAWAMKTAGDEGQKHGITVTVEHLPGTSTNTLTSFKEALKFVKELNHPNVKMMVDYGHVKTMKEDINNLLEGEGYILHLHIRNSKNGAFPLDENEDDYEELFDILKRINYQGKVSIEAFTDDLKEDAARSLKVLKELVR